MKQFIPLMFGLSFSTLGLSADVNGQRFDRAAFYKEKIRTIAKANQSNPNRLIIRNILDPMVNSLIELKESQREDQKVDLVAGTWKSLWSDQEFGKGTDYSQVYQVVNPDGYYYNISKVQTEGGASTAYLRGQFDSLGSYLAIEFTANSIQPGFPAAGTDLVELAEGVESGDTQTTPIPGPIGVTGVLMNIYVDADLRIVYGNSVVDTRPRLFILERVDHLEN